MSSTGEVLISDAKQPVLDALSMTIADVNIDAKWLTVELIDVQAESVATYAVSMANGDKLPDWIKIDPETGLVSIDHSSHKGGEIELKVEAVGRDGEVRVLEINLDLDKLTSSEIK